MNSIFASKARAFAIAFCVGASLLLAAVCAPVAPASAAEQVAIGLRNNGDLVLLKHGQALVVQLPVDAKAGQSWAVSVPPTAPLRLMEDSLDAPGEGGVAVQRLEFVATGTGRGTLSLSVVEPFTPGRGQRLVYSVTVEAK